MKDMFVTTCGLVGGSISQGFIEIPVLGYLIGNFIGSTVGSFVYSAGYSAVLSFCVESGFTMFGLVDQNYTLPEKIIEEIGAEVFKFDEFQYDQFKPEEFTFEKFSFDRFQYDTLGITVLRRGVIGVREIAYV